ncbi:MAG: hypothetical protein Q8P91_00525 [bacterium]|nr:hypothetical protein [bacterium]
MEKDNLTTERLQRVKNILENEVPFCHPDLSVICIGGSNSSNSAGPLSDIDITTIMKPENPLNFDINSTIQLCAQLRKFAFDIADQEGVIPVIISTIRLEEAQLALAEILNPDKIILPIHWLHYPSLEFAAINEPSKLVKGLLNGKYLKGDRKNILAEFDKIDHQQFEFLTGLDWITDSFRVFLSNINNGEFPIIRQPEGFLKKLALHNLEYFWKWNITRPVLEHNINISPDNWVDMAKLSDFIPHDLWILANNVRNLRHKAAWAQPNEIIDLHIKTFEVLPI